MAKQFIFQEEDITKLDKAYQKDMLYSNDLYKISGEELKHIQVLRYNVSDEIIINNMFCKIESMSKDYAVVCKIKDIEAVGIPNVNITLYQSFLKSDKMDYLIQKSVELGVKYINPIFSKNTIVKLEEKDKIKRRDKLNKICIEATKQCGRTDLAEVLEFIDFKNMLNNLSKHDVCILAYEKDNSNLKKVITEIKGKNNIKDIAVIIGPEGGFDESEVLKLNKINNLYTVSLGERILRAETASLNLLSVLIYEFN